MSDLVDRLKDRADTVISQDNARLFGEAATEITRLQNELGAAREALKPFVRQMEREFPDQWPDAMDLRSLNESRWHLKVVDFRRAARVARKENQP